MLTGLQKYKTRATELNPKIIGLCLAVCDSDIFSNLIVTVTEKIGYS